MNAATDEGPAGTKYAPLMVKSTKQARKSVTIKWSAVNGAAKYVIYGALSGKKNKMKRIGTSAGKTMTVKDIAGKKVRKGRKKGTCYIYAYAQNGVYKRIKINVK